jgi:predicted anti-sigma-YlaC factor YlaD
MLRCKEVVRLVASDELAGSGLMRRLAVRMHLAMCRHCRRYAKQIRELGRAAREIWAPGIDEVGSMHRIEDAVAVRIASLNRPPEEPPADDGHPPQTV